MILSYLFRMATSTSQSDTFTNTAVMTTADLLSQCTLDDLSFRENQSESDERRASTESTASCVARRNALANLFEGIDSEIIRRLARC